MDDVWEVVVIGAGAAGLLAATRAAECGRRTLLLEKNRQPGVKILMSGGTRCNLTHAIDRRGIVQAFGIQGRFLHSALAALGPRELVELIEAEGVPTKVESTGKVFPVSDKAADVLDALVRRFNRSGAELALRTPVTATERAGDLFRLDTPHLPVAAQCLIVTTGGQSYPGCGTTGEGYGWVVRFGHTLVPPRPALVPIVVSLPWVAALRGITIPDVGVGIVDSHGRTLIERRGSFLFAHFGLSGPAVLDVSRIVSGHPEPRSLEVHCDFLPDRSAAQLDETIRQAVAAGGRKQLASLLPEGLPQRVTEAIVQHAGLDLRQRGAELSRPDRERLVRAFKQTRLPIGGTLGFKKAEVTAGGISLDEVDSRTMQSRIVPNLFLAGEVLDLDGPIGGFNFQAAFSTGWLAGENAARRN